jgi:hypothetical protein
MTRRADASGGTWPQLLLSRGEVPARAGVGRRGGVVPLLTFVVALVMAGVVATMKGYKTDGGKDLGDAIIGKIKDAVGKVQF